MIFFAKLGRKAQKQTLVDSHFHPDWFFTLFCGRSISVGKWFTDQQPRMEISRARAVLIPNRQNSISDPWPKGRRSAAVDQFTQLFPPSFEGIPVFATKLEGTHFVFFPLALFWKLQFSLETAFLLVTEVAKPERGMEGASANWLKDVESRHALRRKRCLCQ